MRRTLAFLLVFLFVYLLLSVSAGVTLIELSLHLPRHHLDPSYRELAQQRAQAINADLREVQIFAIDGIDLRGWLLKPEKNNGASAILLHGVTDNRLGVAAYGELLARHGYTVLLPDARAHGESGGAIASYGLLEADDVREWVRWLNRTQGPNCVFGFGESMGAGILLQSLDTGHTANFCAVAAESPFADFRHAAIDRINEKLRWKRWLTQAVFQAAVEAGMVYARVRYSLRFATASPLAAVASSQVPTLLIHGLADTTLLPENSEMIHRANPLRTQLWEVSGAGHCGVWSSAPEEFELRLMDWFDSHLAVASSHHSARSIVSSSSSELSAMR